MKRSLLLSSILLGAGLLALALALVFRGRPGGAVVAGQPPSDLKPGWVVAVQDNAAEVFQKAFWRRLAPDDKVLHAERREWSDPVEGVAKWQWFIALQPGAAIQSWQKEGNPFSLVPMESWQAGVHAADTQRPDWFPAAADSKGFRILHSGRMTLLFSHRENLLYATDSGHGFSPAAGGR